MGLPTSRFRNSAFFLVLISVFIFSPAVSTAAQISEKNDNYFEFKAGIYYPSEHLELSDFNEGVRTTFDRRLGFDGELAFGHYYHRYFGMEFGVGYFETKRFAELAMGSMRIESMPVLLSAKLFLPMGPFESYGEIGIGGYFTKFELVNAGGQKKTDRDFEVGPHAGVGINYNFTDSFYMGIRGDSEECGRNSTVRISGRPSS